ncbi:MAG: tetratricopeptide repeat protein, partial [Candidatus Dormiibacterota bacterium]
GLALEALDRCRRIDPKPFQTEARILGHVASMYVVAESWTQAVQYYEAAVEAAGDVKDLLQQAKMQHGLAAAYQRMGNPALARQHYDRALALYSIESDPSATYRLENDLGCLLLQEGHLDSAEAHLIKALTGADERQIDRRGRGFILNSLGELSLRRGRVHEAREYLAQALDSGHATGEGLVQAVAHGLLGALEERQGNPRGADREFEVAFAIVQKLDMPDRLRDLHMEYAAVLEAREDIRAAADHWKQAAELGKSPSAGFKWTAFVAEEVASS